LKIFDRIITCTYTMSTDERRDTLQRLLLPSSTET
jgi:hypothetical protein